MHREFIDAGFRVIGLHPIVNDKCGCGNDNCHMAGKHPWSANWQYAPHWSDEQLETMELSGQFSTGYGVLVSGLLVIDIDPRNGGNEGYAALVDQFPDITGSGLIVATGRGDGGKHIYFRLFEPLALVTKLSKYPGVDFKSAGFVVGPGSQHISGGEYTVLHGAPDDIDEAPQALLDALKKPERHRNDINGSSVDVSHAEIADMLGYLDPDCGYDDWVTAGMAIHHATDGTGFDLWDTWSNGSDKYPGKAKLGQHWHSFGKSANPVTLGTLWHRAKEAGWRPAIADDGLADYWGKPVALDISGIDLTKPPGFVGEVAEWINSQCRYPRERLATGAALVTVGNVIGLNYIDKKDGVTGNLFVFGVADSGSGKNAVLTAASDLHVEAGLAPAVHGSIKSEQEIVSNLVRNQAALYLIDEIGEGLAKIESARKRGGAIYLEGIYGMLMSAYSQGAGRLLLSGDKRDDVRKAIQAEIAQANKRLDEGKREYNEVIAALESRLASLDQGLVRPFLSVYGTGEPRKFEPMVNYDSATSGFFSRALIFSERVLVPSRKRDFTKPPMCERIAQRLKMLAATGTHDSFYKRIENYAAPTPIPTEPEAARLLEEIADIFEEYAHDQAERTGLHSVVVRGYESVSKVSFILAAPSRLRTAEHVLWAYALVKNDIDDKLRLVVASDTGPGSSKKAGLVSRIEAQINSDEGQTIGVIKNRLRDFKPEDIERELAKMVEAKRAETFKGARSMRYRLVR